ncbi:ABC transporter permease [Mesoplasma seiffertii]|uniref:ABC transporter permease n=1 Tax=Mesoplasma seiffertii TaxID=28224 RepID=UPI00047A5F47|nr:ABC transporter permease [Mesoplasma seiffertii]
MKGMRLILKNSLRNSFKNLSQIFGLTMLVAMLALVISLMSSISIRVLDNYNALREDSNQHNIILQIDPFENVPTQEVSQGAPKNLVEAQQYWMAKLQKEYSREDIAFNWSRTEARKFSQVYNNGHIMDLKAIVKTNYDDTNAVDKLVIYQGTGYDDQHTRNVVLDTTFAAENKLAIGDLIRLQKDSLGDQMLVASRNNKGTTDKQFQAIEELQKKGIDESFNEGEFSNYDWYQVSGLGNSADFVMPILDANTPIPNKQREGLIYLHPSNFGLIKQENGFYLYDQTYGKLTITSNNEWESFFNLKTKSGITPTSNQIERINASWKQLINIRNEQKRYVYAIGDDAYRYNNRTQAIESTLKIYHGITSITLILLFIVCLYTIGLITKKQIDKSKSQIGTMKALGYRRRQIIFNYVTTPFITAVMGSFIGFILAQPVQIILIDQVSNYFSLDFSTWKFDYVGFFNVVFILWIFLTFIAFLMALLIFKSSALNLMSANKSTKVTRFGMAIKRLNMRNSFGSKIRTALLINSFGKLSCVGAVVLIASGVMTVAYAAPNALNVNREAAYNGINYNQLVEFNEPVVNNPYTFLKAYNKTIANPEYRKAKLINQPGEYWTNVPLKTLDNGQTYVYDMDKIIKAYINRQVASDYFSLIVQDDEIFTSGVLAANMKLTNSYGLNVGINLQKLMAQKATTPIPGDGSEIMYIFALNQWPDLVKFFDNVKYNKDDQLRVTKVFQAFYKKYINSVFLSLPQIDSTAKSNSEKIAEFNQAEGAQRYLKATDELVDSYEIAMELNPAIKDFNQLNHAINAKTPTPPIFKISDGTNLLGENRIYDNDEELNYKDDKYETIDLDSIKDQETLDAYTYKYMKWFSMYFFGRIDHVIIQAAYSRSPYFVQQNIKEAVKNDQEFNTAFSLVPLDELDQIGTYMNVQSKDDVNFKIYGLDNLNNPFMQLEDEKGNSLNQELFKNSNDNEIVINQTVAQKLKLKKGDNVDLNVIKKLLTDENNQPYTLDQYTGGNEYGSSSYDHPFRQYSDTTSNSKPIKLAGKTLAGGLTDIGEVYQSILKGENDIIDQKTSVTFKVAGIHDGYGTAAAWISNQNANKVLGYDLVEEYFWINQFSRQWGNEFKNPINEEIYLKNWKLGMTLEEFKKDFLNSRDADVATKSQKIYQMFKSSNPVFNYKYSLSEDIGDLKSTISTFQKYGDYSPFGMNGGYKNGVLADGAAEGSIKAIVPTQISKDILNQMSDLVMIVMIFAIVLVLIITFVIILLTTNLIITDNARFIATMKVLGYRNNYIAKTILGMYFIVIGATFAIGTAVGWYAYISALTLVAAKSSMVLPMVFPFWLVIGVAVSVLGIYLVTIAYGFRAITKVNATKMLQNTDI